MPTTQPNNDDKPTDLQAVAKPIATVLYGSSLLSVLASTVGIPLPEALKILTVGVGVNLISGIIERVVRGEEVPDVEFQAEVEKAMSEDGVDKVLTEDHFMRVVSAQMRNFSEIKRAISSGQYEIIRVFTEQFTELSSRTSELQTIISELPTRDDFEKLFSELHSQQQYDRSKIRVFISYAHSDDAEFVEQLHRDLTRHEIYVWRDREAMESRGTPFLSVIKDAIQTIDYLILVFGSGAKQSSVVQQEWECALSLCKAVLPVLRLGDFSLLPPEIARIHAIDFREQSKYEEAFNKLLQNLERKAVPLAHVIGVPDTLSSDKTLSRNAELTAIKALLLQDEGFGKKPRVISKSDKRVGIWGMGGLGKTTIAQMLAADCDVRRAFPDGIYWLTIGRIELTQIESMVVEVQRELTRLLGIRDPKFTSTKQGRIELMRALRDKECLIILDDIWERDHVFPAFDILNEHSRMLITTRNGNVLDDLHALKYSPAFLDERQSLELLSNTSGQALTSLPEAAHRIAELCGGLSLALAMIGKTVGHYPNRWEEKLTDLREAKFDKVGSFLLGYDHSRYPNLYKVFAVTFDDLEVATREIDPAAKKRFYDLAIFREDTRIPTSVIFRLWKESGLSNSACEDLLKLLVDRSVIQFDKSNHTVTIHDLILNYLRAVLGQESVSTHACLLSSYNPDGVPWHQIVDDGYLYSNLVYHLKHSQFTEQIWSLFKSSDWMRVRRADRLQYQPFLSDLAQARQMYQLTEQQDIPRAIALSHLEHVIRKATFDEAPKDLLQLLLYAGYDLDAVVVPAASQMPNKKQQIESLTSILSILIRTGDLENARRVFYLMLEIFRQAKPIDFDGLDETFYLSQNLGGYAADLDILDHNVLEVLTQFQDSITTTFDHLDFSAFFSNLTSGHSLRYPSFNRPYFAGVEVLLKKYFEQMQHLSTEQKVNHEANTLTKLAKGSLEIRDYDTAEALIERLKGLEQPTDQLWAYYCETVSRHVDSQFARQEQLFAVWKQVRDRKIKDRITTLLHSYDKVFFENFDQIYDVIVALQSGEQFTTGDWVDALTRVSKVITHDRVLNQFSLSVWEKYEAISDREKHEIENAVGKELIKRIEKHIQENSYGYLADEQRLHLTVLQNKARDVETYLVRRFNSLIVRGDLFQSQQCCQLIVAIDRTSNTYYRETRDNTIWDALFHDHPQLNWVTKATMLKYVLADGESNRISFLNGSFERYLLTLAWQGQSDLLKQIGNLDPSHFGATDYAVYANLLLSLLDVTSLDQLSSIDFSSTAYNSEGVISKKLVAYSYFAFNLARVGRIDDAFAIIDRFRAVSDKRDYNQEETLHISVAQGMVLGAGVEEAQEYIRKTCRSAMTSSHVADTLFVAQALLFFKGAQACEDYLLPKGSENTYLHWLHHPGADDLTQLLLGRFSMDLNPDQLCDKIMRYRKRYVVDFKAVVKFIEKLILADEAYAKRLLSLILDELIPEPTIDEDEVEFWDNRVLKSEVTRAWSVLASILPQSVDSESAELTVRSYLRFKNVINSIERNTPYDGIHLIFLISNGEIWFSTARVRLDTSATQETIRKGVQFLNQLNSVPIEDNYKGFRYNSNLALSTLAAYRFEELRHILLDYLEDQAEAHFPQLTGRTIFILLAELSSAGRVTSAAHITQRYVAFVSQSVLAENLSEDEDQKLEEELHGLTAQAYAYVYLCAPPSSYRDQLLQTHCLNEKNLTFLLQVYLFFADHGDAASDLVVDHMKLIAAQVKTLKSPIHKERSHRPIGSQYISPSLHEFLDDDQTQLSTGYKDDDHLETSQSVEDADSPETSSVTEQEYDQNQLILDGIIGDLTKFKEICSIAMQRGYGSVIAMLIRQMDDQANEFGSLLQVAELDITGLEGMREAVEFFSERPRTLDFEVWPHKVILSHAALCEDREQFVSLFRDMQHLVGDGILSCLEALVEALPNATLLDIRGYLVGDHTPFTRLEVALVLSSAIKALSARGLLSIRALNGLIKRNFHVLDLLKSDSQHKSYDVWIERYPRMYSGDEVLIPPMFGYAIGMAWLANTLRDRGFSAEYEQARRKALEILFLELSSVEQWDAPHHIHWRWSIRKLTQLLGDKDILEQTADRFEDLVQGWKNETE